MEWYSFRKKRPRVGEMIFVAKDMWKGTNIFIATYLGRINICNTGICDVELDNFEKYSPKSYISQYHFFASENLHWARLN